MDYKAIYFDPEKFGLPKDSRPLERYIQTKFIEFPPYVPVRIPYQEAITLIRKGFFSEVRDGESIISMGTNKALVIRDEGLGDTLLVQPAVRAMAEQGTKVDFMTNPAYFCLFECNPYIHKLISMEEEPRIGIMSYNQRIDLRQYSEHSPNRNKKHRSDVYTDATFFSLQDGKKKPFLKLSIETLNMGKRMLPAYEGKYIGLQVSATHYCRNWSITQMERLVKLGKKSKIKFVLLDRKSIALEAENLINLSGKTTVQEAAGVIAQLDLMVGCDSGLYHIAECLDIPFITLFGIVTPAFRTSYYTCWHKDIVGECPIGTPGCGDFHMEKCAANGSIISHCMESITAEQIWKVITEEYLPQHIPLPEITPSPVILTIPQPLKVLNILKYPKEKILTLAMILLNEEKYIKRAIEQYWNSGLFKRIVIIDGGSTDKTGEICKKAGAEVHTHLWKKDYHDMVACQRNIMMSYIPEGERWIFMDGDELMSKQLIQMLPELCARPEIFMALPRRTFKNYASCLAWTKGEPTEDNGGQIYEYPDFQPRLYIHTRFMKMFRSPHHLTLNQGEPFNIIDADILHYEKEKPELMPSHNDTWESMIRRGKELGLDKWYWDHTLERSKAVKITAELIGGDLEHKINKVKDIGNKPFQRWEEEFNVVKAFIKGKGIDLGCGTDRLSPTIISMDAQPDRKFAFADIVGDCSILSSFSNFCFDFVFSSHCIEDFPPERHLEIIKEWLRVIKPQGYLCLIIPDMEGNRYPRAGDPKGNPSHKADVGLNYFKNLLKNEKVELIQADTIPHKYCSLDLVYKKL